jgi:hypothetical protein
MDAAQESDHTMTSAGEAVAEKTVKSRSGIFGIVAILSSVVIVLVSLTFTVTDSTTTDSAVDPYIKVRVILESDSFSKQGTLDVCSGTKELPNINKSQVFISQGSWQSKVAIGKGLLDNQGDCIYNVSVLPLSTFSGGDVNFSVVFPFGTSPVTTFDVGNSAPYEVALVRLSFNN